MTRVRLSDLTKDIKKAYGDSVQIDQNYGGYRFSTGIVAYDLALGGGYRTSKFHLVVGPSSSGKTTGALKTAAEVQKINWDTGKVDPTYSNPCPVVFIDLENTFDEDWARLQGVKCGPKYEDAFTVIQPTFGEQMCDIVKDIILSHAAALVIIDSLEPVMSMKDVEKSAEESSGLGMRARVLNDAYRRWTAAATQSLRKDKPWQSTTLLALNQFREKIVLMGDNREIPGGRAQIFYSSTITFLNKGKLQKDGTSNFGMGEFSGLVEKNKTATPKKNFSYDMATQPLKDNPSGYVDNIKTIWGFVKSQGDWCHKDGKEWNIFGEKYRVQDEFKDKLSDPVFYAEIRQAVYDRVMTPKEPEE